MTNNEVVRCKECIHRPIIEFDKIKAPKIEDIYDDLTCPFLCDDTYYNRMPKDDFFCAYGDKTLIF